MYVHPQTQQLNKNMYADQQQQQAYDYSALYTVFSTKNIFSVLLMKKRNHDQIHVQLH